MSRNLDEEKLERIVSASIEEFAKGYQNASTNRIVEKAEISKGLLFHYFGNKKKLFVFVLKRYIDNYMERFFEGIDEIPSDFFERLSLFTRRKLEMLQKDPVGHEFLLTAFSDIPKPLQADLTQFYQQLYEINAGIFYSNLDYSIFRDGVDPQHAITLIQIVMNGLTEKYRTQGSQLLSQVDEIMDEFYLYMELLKHGICE